MNITQGKSVDAGSAGSGGASGGTWFAVRDRLYEDQRVAAERLIRIVSSGTNALLVAPTGGGKTHIFAAVVRALAAEGRRALVIAHRRELLEQAHDKLGRAGVPATLDERRTAEAVGEEIGPVLEALKMGRIFKEGMRLTGVVAEGDDGDDEGQ